MNAEQTRKIAAALLGFNPNMWLKDSLEKLMSSPVYLDTMLSIFIGRRWFLKKEPFSPFSDLCCDSFTDHLKGTLATDSQHGQMVALFLTSCRLEHLSEKSVEDFIETIENNKDRLEVEFANFVNRSIQVSDWMVSRILKEDPEKKTYSRFLNHHRNELVLMRLWLRGQEIDPNCTFSEKLSRFSATPLAEDDRFENVISRLGDGRKFSDRILHSVGAATLRQLEHVSSHVWAGKRVFGFADQIGHSQAGVTHIPFVDCRECPGASGRVPGEIKWMAADIRVQGGGSDVLIEFQR